MAELGWIAVELPPEDMLAIARVLFLRVLRARLIRGLADEDEMWNEWLALEGDE